MSKQTKGNIQHYPRIQDEQDKFLGFFDESKFIAHATKISIESFKQIIKEAITNANLKSSRAILNIEGIIDENKIAEVLKKGGNELFKYFVKYCGDPAATAYDCMGIHYREIAFKTFTAKYRNSLKKSNAYYTFQLFRLQEIINNNGDKNLKPTALYLEILVESFGQACYKNKIVDENGYFSDAKKIIEYLCKS